MYGREKPIFVVNNYADAFLCFLEQKKAKYVEEKVTNPGNFNTLL